MSRNLWPRLVITLLAGSLLGGCSLGGRLQLGGMWFETGPGFTLAGNHVALAVH